MLSGLIVTPGLLLKLHGVGGPGSTGTELSTHCPPGNSHFLLLQDGGVSADPRHGGRALPWGLCRCLPACAMWDSPGCLEVLPRDGCVSRGQKDKQTAELSPRASHDVSGSRSVCRYDMTQAVSAWQPAGRGRQVLSYLLRLTIERVLTGPRTSGKAPSQGLACGHERGQRAEVPGVGGKLHVSHTSQQLCNAHNAKVQTGLASPSTYAAVRAARLREARPCFRYLWLGISPARGVSRWC